MPKILVTYFSRTGNTKKIAEAIHDSIGQDAVILPLDKVEDMGPYGLVFIGFPVQSHSVPYKAEVFLKKVPAGKKIALFSTRPSSSERSPAGERYRCRRSKSWAGRRNMKRGRIWRPRQARTPMSMTSPTPGPSPNGS
jgi:flavodoxin